MTWRRLIVTVGLLLAVAAEPMAYAQDGGLTDEQMAWIGRVVDARATREAYLTYVEVGSRTQTRNIEITLGDLSRTISDKRAFEHTITFIKGEDYNVHATISGRVDKTEVRPPGQEDVTSYHLSAEARIVDDVVYLNAVLDEGSGPDMPTLPAGWVLVDDVNQYGDLYLDDLLEDIEPSPYQDEELMRGAAADVTLEAVRLDDGTSADVITVTFDQAGHSMILAAGGDDVDPATQALFDAAGENFSFTLAVTMDADNRPLHADLTLRTSVQDADAHTLAPDQFPEGMLLDFDIEIVDSATYQDANLPVEPIEAPVDLVD